MFKRSRSQRSFANGDDEISVVKVPQPNRPSRADTIASARSSCSDIDPSDYEVHESCVTRNFPKHKSSHLRFLAWVAYTRKYTDESITDDERRTCPLLWCREVFKSQEEMLKHVFNCPHLSKGLYWCFHCQKPERVGNFKCRRCQGAPSRTERISSVAKKIFSKLGARPHRTYDPDVFRNGKDLSNISEHANFHSPMDFDRYQQAQELPNDSVVREMPGDFAASHELSAESNVSEMMGTECPVELGVGSENWADNLYFEEWDDPTLSSAKVQAESPRPPRLSLDTSCSSHSPHAPHAKPAHNFQTNNSNWDDAPLSATIISPLSASGGFDYSSLEISPTDSDETGNTFSTVDSGYTSATSYTAPSAWDFSMTDLPRFGSIRDKGKKREIGQISQDWISGAVLSGPMSMPSIPSVMAQDVTVSRSNSSSTTHSASRCPISERPKPVSPHWRNASDLVQSFSEVLDEHIDHTKTALKELPSTSITQELLAMSRTSMVSLGLDVLQGILEGRNPTAIIQVFAFMHIAFALAIAVDQDEAKVETEAWFKDSLTWVQELPSKRQQQLYLQIARAVWQPLDAASISGLSEVASSPEKQRLLFESCKHFLDVFESLGSSDNLEAPLNRGFDFVQASFERKAKTQVIDELIKKLGIEGFIEDVVSVERRLMQGQITSVRSLELDLIFAGKSDAAYSRFVSHVAGLCDTLYAEESRSKNPRTSYHIRDIAEIKRLLPEENYNNDYSAHQSHIQEQDLFNEDMLLNLDWEPGQDVDASSAALARDLDEILSHHHDSSNTLDIPPVATVPPRPASLPASNMNHLSPFAIPTSSHHRSSSAASASHQNVPPTPHPTPNSSSTAPSPFAPPPKPPLQPSTTPNSSFKSTPTASSSNLLRCHCGYIPTGDEKWFASNLRRHKRTQHPSESKRKIYKCKISGCKSTFTRSDNLRSHRREKHGVDSGRSGRGRRDDVDVEEDEEDGNGGRGKRARSERGGDEGDGR
ncbi:uncharacterized protein PAC_01487 [Phialocephala subalpina]|uniref:C2H2-type domain-containing protein n=1 Tax=Phialocephala subalpina TaxID=576137 RepID=A0A1L7WFR4_9HELO|nr:uncharacterized protein PAC_01487 [Phialocephala subalpina]